MMKIFLTNLGKYNEGYLIGEWVNLPIDDEELEEVKKRIGINELYEEWFISDYETDIDGLEISEYDNIEELNEVAEALENLDETDLEIVEAMLEKGASIKEALDGKDDCMIYYNCDDMSDVAEQYCEECGLLDLIPENLRYYFDFEAFGRDMESEGTFVFTKYGNCVQIF